MSIILPPGYPNEQRTETKSAEGPMSHVCDCCDRRSYACRLVVWRGDRPAEVSERANDPRAEYVCPMCYRELKEMFPHE